jgi:DNA polymerase (family 10)
LDLKDTYIREAIDHGVKIAIDSDAHHKDDYDNLRYGIGQARRGWATAKDVLNTLPVAQFLRAIRQA